MAELIGNNGVVEIPEGLKEPDDINTSEEVTEDHFKKSLRSLDYLALEFEAVGNKLADRKKKGNFRVLRAILFETEETNKTFGKEEKLMLDLSRKIMYHRQIVEIFLMKQENENLLKEFK